MHIHRIANYRIHRMFSRLHKAYRQIEYRCNSMSSPYGGNALDQLKWFIGLLNKHDVTNDSHYRHFLIWGFHKLMELNSIGN